MLEGQDPVDVVLAHVRLLTEEQRARLATALVKDVVAAALDVGFELMRETVVATRDAIAAHVSKSANTGVAGAIIERLQPEEIMQMQAPRPRIDCGDPVCCPPTGSPTSS